jgi:hypothetical protein
MSRSVALTASVLLACGNSDVTEPPWTAVAEERASALLSVWGSSSSDIWVVGGDPDDGTGPIVLHYDGTDWTKLDTNLRNIDLWWVYGFAGGPVFMSGSNGTIVRFENGTFVNMPTPANTSIVFGMYGATPDDVWAVGGGTTGGGFAWRFDGNAWAEVAVPIDPAQDTLFKVSGIAADNVWLVGSRGTALHWDGSQLAADNIPVDGTLLSVAGNSERFVAAGGNFDGVLYENDGSGWVSKLPTGGDRLVGVSVSEDAFYTVGISGTILERGADGKWAVDLPRQTNLDLHAAWIDSEGGVWAVGGKFDTPPLRSGVLLHKGEPLQGSVP